MKAKEQTTIVNAGFDTSTHSLFGMIAAKLQAKIEADTGVKVVFSGKNSRGKGSMTAVITGDFTDPDQKKIEDIEKRVKQMMADLRNPTNLIALLKG